MKSLVLLTSEYPYGKGEAFIEDEIYYLSEAFERVIIIPKEGHGELRPLPANCVVVPFEHDTGAKKQSYILKVFINSLFWNELWRVMASKRYQTWQALKVMIISLASAIHIKDFIIKKSLCDNILYSYWCDDSSLALALIKAKNKTAKVYSRCHRWDVYEEEHLGGYLPFKAFIYSTLNNIFPISEDGKRYIEERYSNFISHNIVTSRLGVEKKIESKLSQNTDYRNPFVLVSCSALITRKRVKLIIDCLSFIDKWSIHWVHFGDGIENDYLREYAKQKLSIHTGITYDFKGQVSKINIIQYYAEHAISLFVNVSESEGIPVSIMEAMAYGIPAIVTNVGANVEIVEDKYNGMLLSANPTVEDVANAVKKVICMTDPEYALLRANAMATWREKYNANLNYRTFVRYLKG